MLGETSQLKSSGEEEEEEDSLSYVDDEDDEDYKVEEANAEVAEKGPRRRGRGAARRINTEEEQAEDLTAGDVFALELELNRENKKMMKVRRRSVNNHLIIRDIKEYYEGSTSSKTIGGAHQS